MSLAALSVAAREYRRAVDRLGVNVRIRAHGKSDALKLPPPEDDEAEVESALTRLRTTALLPVEARGSSTVVLSESPPLSVDVQATDAGVRLSAAGELCVVPLGYCGPHDLYHLAEVMQFAARAVLGPSDVPELAGFPVVDAFRRLVDLAAELCGAGGVVALRRGSDTTVASELLDTAAGRAFAAAAVAFARVFDAPADSGPISA